MVANNDLIFHDGWLHGLLAANHPVVSPKNPGDMRQADVTKNTAGFTNGRHFSGWCFMVKRYIWERIGGFDPDFEFWCADDAVIEQLKAIGQAPMLVPGSTVQHLTSVTLDQAVTLDRDDLTWKFVDLFNRKYHQNKFAEDPRFEEWKKNNGRIE